MRRVLSLLSWLLLGLLAGAACDEAPPLPIVPGGGGGVDVVGELSNTTCLAFETPRPEDVVVELAVVFGGETFNQPMKLLQHPVDDDRWYVVQKGGLVITFLGSDPSGTRVTALNAQSYESIHTGGEQGLLGMAFHPDFSTNGEIYLHYTASSQGRHSVIARFVSSDGGQSFVPHATAAEVLRVVQPAGNHNGGDLAFGPDGYLYASLGDGGGANDTYGNGQNTDTMLGAIIRIDVDTRPGYSIPADNPLVNDPTADAKEIFAYGLRNPWRMSFDSLTGDLWLGDVGQNSWEEIDLIVSGGNYGWPLREGFVCFPIGSACAPDPSLIEPVVVHGRSVARAISGGYVYRGDDIVGLAGAYVYADYATGRIWGLFDGTGSSPQSFLLLATNPLVNIPGFGQGRDGEIYVLDAGTTSEIRRLVPPVAGPPNGDGPATQLSVTGCVDPTDPLLFAPGVIPYDLNAPLWSDGAGKRRGLAVPNGTTIQVDAEGDFVFPIGSVLVKHFLLDGLPIETRLFMLHEDDSWTGYSYEWDAMGMDATLLDDGQEVDIDGLLWTYPSPGQCLECHTEVAGFSLGPEVAQLERDFDYGASEFTEIAGVANQLDALYALGVLATPPPAGRMPLPELDSAASAEERSRAYLHANCSFCHQPDGPGGGAMDLRFETPLEDTGVCDVMPLQGDLGLVDARIVAPAAPERSVLLARMLDTGAARMPPLASVLVDDEATMVVEAWIMELAGCP